MQQKFPHMARLISKYREKTTLSQTDLSRFLGFKNGQFISNVERGLCTIPLKKGLLTCKFLFIPKGFFREAYIKDVNLKINNTMRII